MSLQRVLQKLFGIYPGEGRNTLRFVRLSIFWGFSTSCFEILSDGLFLEKIGASFLPSMYLIGAISLIAISTIIIYSLKIVSPYKILKWVMLSSSILCFCVILTLPFSPPHLFWFFLKVFSRLFFSVFLATAWTFIDQYHDLQDAKRVYSLYSAAYFLGIVIAGTTINFFLHHLGYLAFFTFTLFAVLFAYREAFGIVRKTRPVHDDTIEGVFSGDRNGFTSMIALLFKSPYALALLALSLFQEFIFTTTDINYMETFEKTFQSDSFQKSFTANHISEFLGKCRAWISFANILIGAFLYRPFIKHIGLHNVILITPIFFFIIYSGWIVQDTLLIAILGLIAVDGIAFTVEDNSFNLLTKAVPTKLKSKVRIINDSFFEPIGMLIASFCFFLLNSFQSRVLGFILSIFLIVTTLILRGFYPKALFINLLENMIQFEKKIKDWFKQMGDKELKETIKDSIQALDASDEKSQLLAAQSLLSLNQIKFISLILNAADHFSENAKIELLELLDKSKYAADAGVIEKIDDWIKSSISSKLLHYTNFYLAKRGLLNPEKEIENLNHNDLFIRAPAILALKKSENKALFRTIADKEIDLLLKDSEKEEIIMGLKILAELPSSESFEKALMYLSHECSQIRRHAAYALSKVADKSVCHFSEKLIQQLADPDAKVRLYTLNALGNIGDSTTVKDILSASIHFRPSEKRLTETIIENMGLKTVPALLSFLKDVNMNDRARILASKILTRLSLPQLQANLSDILSIEMERAYFYFYYGHTIQKRYPLYDLSLLESALLTSLQSVIDFIIHLLGACGRVDDCEVLVLSLQSKNEKVHSSAVETLSKACDLKTFSWILPLIEDVPLEEKMTAYFKHMGHKPPLNLSGVLNKLNHSPSIFNQIAAARLKAKLKMPEWRKQLREKIKTCDETFHHFAYELLEYETVKLD